MTTRILALTDALGNLVRFRLMPGQRHDSVEVPPLIDGLAFDGLIADKAFDSNALVAGITFVGDCRASLDVRTSVRQERKMRRTAFLATGQIEGDEKTVEVGFQVDFGGEAPARSAGRLTFPPPFAPAAETWARTIVESNICTRLAVEDNEARCSKNKPNVPALLRRSNRFHTLFHFPKRSGNARQVMLWIEK